MQAMPIPKQLAGNARQVLEAHGEKHGIDFELLPAGTSVASVLGRTPEPFFSAQLPSGETLLHRLSSGRSGRRHPLQFGREAVATLLGNPARADWKVCLPHPAPGEKASIQQLEARMAEDFKAAFAAYDPVGGEGAA